MSRRQVVLAIGLSATLALCLGLLLGLSARVMAGPSPGLEVCEPECWIEPAGVNAGEGGGVPGLRVDCDSLVIWCDDEGA